MVLVVTVSPPKTAVRRAALSDADAGAASGAVTDPDAFDVTATLSADGDAKPQTIEAALRRRVEIIVEGVGPDSVELGDLRTDRLRGRPAGALRRCWRRRRAPTRWSSTTSGG